MSTAVLLGLLTTCAPNPSALERIQAQGVMTVAALNGSTGCFEGVAGAQGFECELLQGFANKLGTRLDLRFYDSAAEVIAAVQRGDAFIGAGGINMTPLRRLQVRFGPALRTVTPHVVYRDGKPAPQALDQIIGRLTVPVGDSSIELLRDAHKHQAQIVWNESADDATEDLLAQVAEGSLDYTIANSDIIAINQNYYPQLRAGPALSQPQSLGWALPWSGGASLQDALRDYLSVLPASEMDRLRDRYFGHLNALAYDDVSQFSEDVEKRLPRYRKLFESAAQRYGIDWHLLAAVGYQESHWNASAVSVTGVRGLMMLTVDTAGEMNVDRADAAQSISGAAHYLSDLLQQLPPSVTGPDREWMALTAYNLGMAHLLDARELTRVDGGNPDHWVDLRKTLAQLSRPATFKRTTHGFARGNEAITFVGNVRSYTDILQWMNSDTAVQTAETREKAVARAAG